MGLALALAAMALGICAAAAPGAAQPAAPAGGGPVSPPPGAAPADGAAPPVEFSAEYLKDPRNAEQGRRVWMARCQFCHGRTAYPGKAPRLDPSRYTPEFVYDRVANGFRGMPPWRHEFSVDELKAVVAYVLSKDFSN